MKKLIARVEAKIMDVPRPENNFSFIAEGHAETIYGSHFYGVETTDRGEPTEYRENLQEHMHILEDDINEVLVDPTIANGYEPPTSIMNMEDMEILRRLACLEAKLKAINVAYIHSHK